MRHFANRLAVRTVLGVLAVNAILIPALFGGVLYAVRMSYEAQFVEQARSEAHLVAKLVSGNWDRLRIERLIDDALLGGHLFSVRIFDAVGRPVAAAGDPMPTFKEDFFFGQHGDQRYHIAVPLVSDKGVLRGRLQLAFDESVTHAQISLAYRLGTFIALGYLLLTLALAVFMAPQLTRPLQRLRRISQRIAAGHLEQPLDVHTSILEIRGLAQDLDFMRRQLAQHATALEHQALHDALTGLANRALLNERLRHALAVAKRDELRFALLLIDLDRFKEINDTLGHHIGDQVLQHAADRLRDSVRASDTVARLGGDEFALVTLSVGADSAAAIAQKIIKTLSVPYNLEGHRLQVGASAGIALWPEHGDELDTLLRKADIAMYEAKRRGNGVVIYEAGFDHNTKRRLRLGGELPDGIRRGELVLHYQPKLCLATGRIDGVEALARWRHPRYGLLLPDEFIGLAETTGAIASLTTWVIAEALRQYARWRDDGLRLRLAVNVSARDPLDEGFVNRIAAALSGSNIDPSVLEVELTESAVVADPARVLRAFTALTQMGMQVSIDDFGAGYSSLIHLAKLPLSRLKIDRSFILDFDDASNLTIVQAIITLAHNLGLSVTAEGVDKAQTLARLREMHCDSVQGNFISPPLPPAELLQWARGHDASLAGSAHPFTPPRRLP